MRLGALLLVLPLSLHAGACGPADDAGRNGPGSSAEGDAAVDDPLGGTEGGPPSAGRRQEADEAAGPAGEAQAPRVVFLGTSLTAGLGLLRESERYTERLQAIADSAGLAARMVNAGVSGETSAGGLRRLDWLLGEPLDVLVVELGANDGLRGQDPAALESNLREIVRHARARWPDVRVVLVGMEAPPNLGGDYTARFRAVYPRVARELGVPLVPFLLEGVAGVPRLNQGDGIHPTADGHARMARNVWPVLSEVLRSELAEADGGRGVRR